MDAENKNCNNAKQTSNTSKATKNKIVITLILIILVLILIVILFGPGYSKYAETINGEASAEVAKMICEMEVVPSEANKTIINPYCMVTVKDYNSNDEITETDVQYTIEVTPKADFEMPSYYWEDSNGNIIARSTGLSGSFKNANKDNHEYKIVFLNPGEKDITRLVEFNLVAIQGLE